MRMRIFTEREIRRNSQRGSSLAELMVAMLVLAVGLGAITVMLTTAVASNNRNGKDTTATMLAQMVIEQISAQNIYFAAGNVTVTDCAGNSWTLTTTGGAALTGAGATLKTDGTIDFTQDPSTLITNGYAMDYVDCSNAGGVQTTYDVRWNVMSVSTNTTTQMVTAGARPLNSNVKQLGDLYFALPVTLRGIGAPGVGE